MPSGFPRYTNAHSQQRGMKVLVATRWANTWNFHSLFLLAIGCGKCAVTSGCDFIFHFSVTNEVEHIFTFLLTTQVSSYPFFYRSSLFFCIICCILSIFWVYVLQLPFPTLRFGYFPFVNDLCKQKFLILIRSNLSVFIWWWILFGLFLKKCLPMSRLLIFLENLYYFCLSHSTPPGIYFLCGVR